MRVRHFLMAPSRPEIRDYCAASRENILPLARVRVCLAFRCVQLRSAVLCYRISLTTDSLG